MRVMGSTISGAFSGADRAIFEGLRARGLFSGNVEGRIPAYWRGLFLAKTFRPSKFKWYKAWTHEMTKTDSAFRLRTRSADRMLRAKLGSYDVVLHISGLFAPFRGAYPMPVGIFCDYTTKLAEANYGPWFGLKPSEARRWYDLEARLYADCSVLLTASENTRKSLLEHYSVDSQKVRVVGEGVDGTTDHPGKWFEEKTVLFVGIDFERKGGQTLLKAFSLVKASLPESRLLVAGPRSGPEMEGVEWLGHVGDRGRISDLFGAATVFTLPSICEPFGLAAIEAMSHGLPVVATAVDAMPELVQDGVTGYLVPPHDEVALAERLVRLLKSPETCEALGSAGRLRVENQFLWRLVVDRIEESLRAISTR